jgi:hypothetical protein
MGGEALISGIDFVPQVAGGLAVLASPVAGVAGWGIARIWLRNRNALPIGLGIGLGLLALGAVWWFELVAVPAGIRSHVA